MVGARPKVGDVFAIPVQPDEVGLGQVVATYGKSAYYFAIFDRIVPREQAEDRVDEVLASRLLFLALSLDAKLHVGDWSVIATRPVAADLPLPAYKEVVGSRRKVEVVDFSGKRRRTARSDEAELLPNRKVVAPVRLEKALRAKAGLEPWHEAYSELAPDETMTTARLFG